MDQKNKTLAPSPLVYGFRNKLFLEAFRAAAASAVRLFSGTGRSGDKKDRILTLLGLALFLGTLVFGTIKGQPVLAVTLFLLLLAGIVLLGYSVISFWRTRMMEDHFLSEAREAARSALADNPPNSKAAAKIARVSYEYGGKDWTERLDGEEHRADAALAAFAEVLDKHGIRYTSRCYLD